MSWVATLIPKDKYNIFLSLFKFPTPVIELTEKIFNELERVFDGRDKSFNYQFKSLNLREDWEQYRLRVLKEPLIWRQLGWDTFKSAINSFVVVDMPLIQQGDRPEPYFYFLDISNVIEYDTIGSEVQYIVFKQNEFEIAVIDDTYYRKIEFKGDKMGKILVENAHNLGYCPVKFFWDTSVTLKSPDVKKSPLTPQLSNLDWLLFFTISKRHLDLYAPYPIYSAYEADCNFQNNATGDYCDGGFLRNINGEYSIFQDGTVSRCPICSEKRLAGAGSFIEVPAPKAGEPDLRKPVEITTIDRAALDYNVIEESRLRQNIYASVVGKGGDTQSKEAVNELQISANFEDKTSTLNALKVGFETIQKFVDDTVCILRYGNEFIGSTISYGSEFYIYSIKELYSQYNLAKSNGASESELDAINDQIIATQNKNSPLQLQRMMILKHLEPYRHYTRNELMTIQEKGLTDSILMKIKINFNSYIDRFERENLNITEFGRNMEFNDRVNKIKEQLLNYAKEETN